MISRFIREEEGQGLVEFFLILGVVSAVAVAVLSFSDGNVSELLFAAETGVN